MFHSSQVADLDTKQLNRLAQQLNITGRSKMTQPEVRKACEAALKSQEQFVQEPITETVPEPISSTQDEPQDTQETGAIETTSTSKATVEVIEELPLKKPLLSKIPTTSGIKEKPKVARCKTCHLDLSDQFDNIGAVSVHFGVIRTPKADGAKFVRYFHNCRSCCKHRAKHGEWPRSNPTNPEH